MVSCRSYNLKEIHNKYYDDMYDKKVKAYRESNKMTQKDMQKLMEWYNSLTEVTIKDIIEFHARFEKIHPFQDGNGRVGRIIAFKECLKNNIIPFIILDKNKLFYYRGLKEYQNKTEKGYLIDTCLNAQDQYVSMIKYYLM